MHFCAALQEYRQWFHEDGATEHKLIKAAVQLCVPIAQPQAPGKGTNYHQPLSSPPPTLVMPSICQYMWTGAQESKLHLFLSLSPSLSPFLHLNFLLGIILAPLVLRQSTSRLLTQVQEVTSVPPHVPLSLLTPVALKFAYDYYSLLHPPKP